MTPAGSAPRWLMGTLLLAVLAGVVVVGLAYLPYVSAGSWYVPLNPGQGSRINAPAALCYVAIIYGAAAAAAALLRRALPPRAAALPALRLAAYAVLASMHRAVPQPRHGATIYASGSRPQAARACPCSCGSPISVALFA